MKHGVSGHKKSKEMKSILVAGPLLVEQREPAYAKKKRKAGFDVEADEMSRTKIEQRTGRPKKIKGKLSDGDT